MKNNESHLGGGQRSSTTFKPHLRSRLSRDGQFHSRQQIISSVIHVQWQEHRMRGTRNVDRDPREADQRKVGGHLRRQTECVFSREPGSTLQTQATDTERVVRESSVSRVEHSDLQTQSLERTRQRVCNTLASGSDKCTWEKVGEKASC